MPSPFPGMNPWLERPDVWVDVHNSLVLRIRDALVPLIRPAYVARIEEHLYLRELADGPSGMTGRPDVAVLPARADAAGAGTAVADPVAVRRPWAAPVVGRLRSTWDEFAESFVEIRDRRDRRVVTVIEVLSRSNKEPGPDREAYLLKRRRLLRSEANLVEIDLLRCGLRPPVDGLPASDYCVTVSRPEDRPAVEVWPVKLRERLPVVPVPLRAPDGDVPLDLQTILQVVYDAAGYADDVYDEPPDPPLGAEDAAWARGLLAGAAATA